MELLQLKSEEMKHRVFEVNDVVTAEHKISSIEKNVLQMKASATALNALYEACPEGEELRKIEEATTEELTELRKSQEESNKMEGE